ncbi:hypothetical protein DH2020_022110 [Rehmannia glutinosa]|uniref:RING-type domain-containing protein n=1 Tax=Rehmannia glutinosa TaxID=99300 RepID=A0ABR0WGN4_REHGL
MFGFVISGGGWALDEVGFSSLYFLCLTAPSVGLSQSVSLHHSATAAALAPPLAILLSSGEEQEFITPDCSASIVWMLSPQPSPSSLVLALPWHWSLFAFARDAMGFDIECIIDIHTYPGEYFCPVCRTLVYPNEAFQSQCTHLYCKPCLTHIANGSKACPYDGYLVTESDSKPLMDSDKALAENIGKVKVHCLYFRSGCTWEGTLSDCTSHCSGCSFGNSPVICNRCGIQIVHRQVHDHAQSCPGVYEGQHAVGIVSGITKSGTVSSTTEVNQAAAQSGAPLSQAQNPQNVAATPLPGQNPNMQVNAHSQAAVVAPVAVPTPEQWYQQQYQQYYQQYVGYDPYQQTNQQYYPLQQQPFQQYQQHPVQVQGQQQSHVYSQPQHQPQPQANPVPQAPQQPHLPQAQVQAQSQPQTQLQLLPQSQSQLQVPPQGQAQLHTPMQALVPNYQVNPQQQPHPPMRPQTQIPPQTLPPPPQSQSAHPPPYAQAMGMRPPAQHPQVPQYQQPHVQMHHPQPSQAHVQPQMQSQAQPQAQSSNQFQPQVQPYHTQSQPPVFPPQANQSTAPAALPQAPHQSVPPPSGHHSYQHPQPPQKMHSGASQQQLVHPQSGSVHPVQVHGQIPQQHALVRPPSHGSMPQQHPSTLLPPQNQVPVILPTPHQQFPSHAQQPSHPLQHRPIVQPAQQVLPQNYAQQQHFPASFHSQLHQQGHLTQQQSMQSQMRPSGPPPAQQSQNFVGRPVMPNQGMHSQSHPFPSGSFGSLAHTGPAQLASTQTSGNQNYAKSTVLEPNATIQEIRSPSKGLVEKGGEPLNEEVVMGQTGTVVKDTDSDASANKSVIKQDGNHVRGALEQASGKKFFEAGVAEDEFRKEEAKLLADSDSLKQVDLENLSNTVVAGPSSTNFDKQSHTTVSASSAEGHLLPPHSHGSHQQRPQTQVQGQPPSILGPQGSGISPHPGQSLNSSEGRVPGYFGPPKIFESQSGPQGPAPTTLADPRGIMGRAPPVRFEAQYGPQHVGRPSEVPMSKDQMSSSGYLSGSGEGGPISKAHSDEPSSLRMNGLAPDSSIPGSRDENKALSRELLNPFPGEPTRNLDQASRYLDKAPHGPIYNAGSKMDPAALGPHSRFLPHHPSGAHGHTDVFGPGPEFGQHHMKHFSRRSPDRDYLGSSPRGFGGPSSFPRGTSSFDDVNSKEAHRFGEGSRSFHLPSDPAGNPFRDGRFPPTSGHMRRGDLDGPGNPRFGELSGPGNFPRLPFNESVRGDRLGFPHFGEPPMRNNYSLPGFPSAGNFSGGMDSFDQSRKRKPVSSGWCRICEVDCESVEGLDMHSQTREHQNMAMDIVKSIKLQNKKKQRGKQEQKSGHCWPWKQSLTLLDAVFGNLVLDADSVIEDGFGMKFLTVSFFYMIIGSAWVPEQTWSEVKTFCLIFWHNAHESPSKTLIKEMVLEIRKVEQGHVRAGIIVTLLD